MTPDELSERIINRIYYVNKKSSTCAGYSTKEKEARIEELSALLDYVDGFRVKRQRLK